MKANAQTTHVLRAIAALLKAGRDQDAARILIRDLRRTAAPRDADLGGWLIQAIGAKPAKRLIHALAHYPCFYCKNGLEECSLCGMRSPASNRRVCCEHCLDLLHVRCDFCDGSGWITYNAIPRGLWPAIILARAQTALSGLAALPSVSARQAKSAAPRPVRKRLEKELLALNRLAGILENAVDAVKKYKAANGAPFKPLATAVVVKSRAAWYQIRCRMREILLLLADTLRREADKAQTAKAGEIMRDRAAFYVTLSKSPAFSGTSLCHPFLPSK